MGGESTRPGADDITSDEELRRAAVEAGADIVNDVSGGTYDPDMFSTVAALGVPIILMHMRGNPKTMQSHVNYDDVGGVVDGVAKELSISPSSNWGEIGGVRGGEWHWSL